jgi:hypothetical protein
LRATYATIAVDQGLPISKLQALLGHADAATTSIYIRPEAQHAALDPRAVLVACLRHGHRHGGRRAELSLDTASLCGARRHGNGAVNRR